MNRQDPFKAAVKSRELSLQKVDTKLDPKCNRYPPVPELEMWILEVSCRTTGAAVLCKAHTYLCGACPLQVSRIFQRKIRQEPVYTI